MESKMKRIAVDIGFHKAGSTHCNDDLMAEILVRVPMKTLYTCKCVCKHWQKLISDPYFMNRFIARLKLLQPCITGVYCVENTDTRVRFEEGAMNFLDFGNNKTDTQVHNTCLSFLPSSVLVVASHNGYLLCVKKPINCSPAFRLPYQYVLCNPLTKEWMDLPKHNFVHHLNYAVLCCYAKVESYCQQIEFKVVLFSLNWHINLQLCTYSSNTGNWKLTRLHSSTYGHPSYRPCFFLVNQLVYWLTERSLCIYDLRKETGNHLELPHESHSSLIGRRKLGVSDGALYLAASDKTCFSVWVLVERVQWSLVHNVSFESLTYIHPQEPTPFYVLAFHPLDPQIILVKSPGCNENLLFLYNTGTSKIERTVNNFRPDEYFSIVPCCLPPWIPFLKSV